MVNGSSHLAYLGLGSNLGDGAENLRRAIALLEQNRVGRILAVADFVISRPWGFESEHLFTNTVAAIETAMSPETLLDITQEIEKIMGRENKHRPGEPYEDRIIDIDILTYDDLHLHNQRLTLPHPHIEARDFVREPLAECRKLVARLQNNKYNH